MWARKMWEKSKITNELGDLRFGCIVRNLPAFCIVVDAACLYKVVMWAEASELDLGESVVMLPQHFGLKSTSVLFPSKIWHHCPLSLGTESTVVDAVVRSIRS